MAWASISAAARRCCNRSTVSLLAGRLSLDKTKPVSECYAYLVAAEHSRHQGITFARRSAQVRGDPRVRGPGARRVPHVSARCRHSVRRGPPRAVPIMCGEHRAVECRLAPPRGGVKPRGRCADERMSGRRVHRPLVVLGVL